MQLLNRTCFLFKVYLIMGFSVFSLTACKGIGQSMGSVSDDVGRAANNAKKVSSPAKVAPPINRGTQQTYRVVNVRQSADELIASIDTANGLYQIYVDCRSQLITRGQVSPTESANVIRDVCSFVAGKPSETPNNLPIMPDPSSSVDPTTEAKERAWQDYYQGCGGDYQQFEATFRDVFERSWRETGAKPNGCG